MNRCLSFAFFAALSISTHDEVHALVGVTKPRKVVVIGGGWAGFSAADALSRIQQQSDEQGGASAPAFDIEILDASPRGPGGLAAGWRTPKLDRPVEAGLHGFWREYQNTFAAIERIGLELDDVLTPFTPSILVSQSGRVALSPVLGDGYDKQKEEGSSKSDSTFGGGLAADPASLVTSRLAELLPPPLDLALLSEFEGDNPLATVDRLSGIGALGAWADFEQEDPKSWERYDNISAENLFKSIAGVTPVLYNELVSPLLHVLPMTPGYDCSAAAALSCLHVFALQTRGAFDVRWCRGTITEKIFNPWSEQLQERGNVYLRGGAKVTAITDLENDDIDVDASANKNNPSFRVSLNDGDDAIDADCIVFAIGGTSLKRLLPACPPLAKLPQTKAWKNFRGVTCVAVRLFFETEPLLLKEAMKDSPVVVCGANVGEIPELSETGFCIYDLERIQDSKDVVSAFEVDFFRADPLTSLTDEEVVRITLNAVTAAFKIPPIHENSLADLSVVRARDAVSHFCVGSASWSPDVKLSEGLYICGDWIDRTGHASWSTEKSVVTGIQAAATLADDFKTKTDIGVIPAAPDTPQLSALRQFARTIRGITPSVLKDMKPQAPWTFARRFF
mmetsp:Transcript_2560/g.5235  ORF Transcript_2560/g.5235 Transcript_2560/m.5235 type:complete len:620 (-) Transcript_2560:3006-4865(-)